jgi:hypothetical protein
MRRRFRDGPAGWHRAEVLVLRSQLALLASLLICTALMPRFLFSRNMGGVSNYGTHLETVLPYTLGAVLGTWWLWQSAADLRAVPGADRLVTVMRVVSLCLTVNLATTYTYRSGPVQATVHSWTAIALALAEFFGGILLLRSIAGAPGTAWRAWAYLLLATGFCCLVLTYLGRLHVLFVAEVTTAGAFGLTLVRAVRAHTVTAGHEVNGGTPPAEKSRRE